MIVTPDEVRTLSNISDNVNSKVLAAAIRTVQDDELMLIVGEPLLDKLKDVKENGGPEITPDQKAPAGRAILHNQQARLKRLIMRLLRSLRD